MTDHDHPHHGHDSHALAHNGAAAHGAHGHDDWFRHTPDEPHAQTEHGNLNAGLISAFLAGTVLLVAVVSFAIFQYFQHVVRHDKRLMQELRTPRAEYVATVTKWNGELTDPAATNQPYKSIDEGMQAVIARYQSR